MVSPRRCDCLRLIFKADAQTTMGWLLRLWDFLMHGHALNSVCQPAAVGSWPGVAAYGVYRLGARAPLFEE